MLDMLSAGEHDGQLRDDVDDARRGRHQRLPDYVIDALQGDPLSREPQTTTVGRRFPKAVVVAHLGLERLFVDEREELR
ncbi:hypothetical protein SAMN05444580_10654 [Rhodococcus tukisamuensis]|uniref:Uncharacterized protein n=2 Tax=Rhodococcus tukisamuensis TaxID=168276 RepID=A0A1G6X3J8_9NOCA|nr:hypothetical protein SAMN05444580_10654 [Rhodococcus tukisamuensis]